MGELDAEWERRVAEAAERACAVGRADVADYLTLRAANDVARAVGVQWLIDAFTVAADEALLKGADLRLDPSDDHSFRVSQSTMVGRQLTILSGLVRALTVEAGWPRTPADGVVLGGGIARARVSHFGDRAPGEELLLVRLGDEAPRWLVLTESGAREAFNEQRAHTHITRLTS
ncbi:MAG: hypothetical protein QOE33_632 [Acidobacteriota bacterium]|nr:hypothetical protein [Acidobacteriota bacterium]